MTERVLASVITGVVLALFAIRVSPVSAFTQTIDDADAVFTSWNGELQVASDPSAVGGSYHFIDDWADSSPNKIARVTYQLSGVPAGNNLYHVSFSSPSAANFGTPGSIAQWHVFNIAADGTENFAQNIPWGGQFGTNKQWLGPTDFGYNPGAFTLLGRGPQNDQSLGDGAFIWLNGSGAGQPYIYIGYQPFYTGPIAFDAITVSQLPEPGTTTLAVLGVLGLGGMAWWRRRNGRA